MANPRIGTSLGLLPAAPPSHDDEPFDFPLSAPLLSIRPDGEFAYDSTGNRVKMRDSTGRYTYTFDAVSRMTVATNPANKRITTVFDAIGQRSYSVAPTGGRFTTTYDAAGRITRVLNPEADRTSYTYDNASRQTVKKLSTGARTSLTYDSANNLTTEANLNTGGTIQSKFDYRYDSAGNRVGVTESDASRVTWLYDNTYQLTGENRTGTSPYRNTFTYDSRGNRTLKNETGVRVTTVYDAANQIKYSQATGGRTTYTFDSNGNQQRELTPIGAITTTIWDYENQPTLYKLSDATRATMTYSAENQRQQKQSATGTTKFIWDEQNILAETDGSDVVQTVYTNEPKQFGNLVSTRLGTTPYYHHFDALGSTRQLTNAAGTVTDTVIYDAWGNVISRTGSTAVRMLWVGEVGYYFDPETGLFSVRRRPYGPTIGRWTTVDPIFSGLLDRRGIGMIVADLLDVNVYRYAASNPLVIYDPSGLASCKAVINTGTSADHREGRIWPTLSIYPWYYWMQYYIRAKAKHDTATVTAEMALDVHRALDVFGLSDMLIFLQTTGVATCVYDKWKCKCGIKSPAGGQDTLSDSRHWFPAVNGSVAVLVNASGDGDTATLQAITRADFASSVTVTLSIGGDVNKGTGKITGGLGVSSTGIVGRTWGQPGISYSVSCEVQFP